MKTIRIKIGYSIHYWTIYHKYYMKPTKKQIKEILQDWGLEDKPEYYDYLYAWMKDKNHQYLEDGAAQLKEIENSSGGLEETNEKAGS